MSTPVQDLINLIEISIKQEKITMSSVMEKEWSDIKRTSLELEEGYLKEIKKKKKDEQYRGILLNLDLGESRNSSSNVPVEELRIVMLVFDMVIERRDFLRKCTEAGMTIKKLNPYRYEINGYKIDFKRYISFSDIAGLRADILVNRTGDGYDKAILSLSKNRVLADSITTKGDLFQFLLKKQSKGTSE